MSSLVSKTSDFEKPGKALRCTVEGCNAVFSKNYKLNIHIRKHTGERPFVCDEEECDKSYRNSSHLRRHKKISHGEREQESIICEHEGCGTVLANKYSLKKHYNRKHNNKNYAFTCTKCTQGFRRKNQLQQHLYLHTGEAPFKCDDCEMCFTTNRNLNRHKRSHCTYTCDCGEVFSKWSLLLIHKKSCKQPRFKCEICNKIFSHSGNYKNHKLIHVDTSEKMVFVCPYPDCKRFYFYKKNLKHHINIFHKKINENKSYNCTYPKCTVVLKTKQSLKMHLQRHFKFIQKKQRQVRCDKGKPKKSMVSFLTGIEHSEEGNSENQLGKDQVHIAKDMSDEILLSQCDVMLSLLNEKLIATN